MATSRMLAVALLIAACDSTVVMGELEDGGGLTGCVEPGAELMATEDADLRGGPSAGDEKLLVIAAGTSVVAARACPEEGYYQVEYQGDFGWVSGRQLELSIACTPESDTALCSRLAKDCGSVLAADNCGTSRAVACGSCLLPQTCGGGGTANVCGGGTTGPLTDRVNLSFTGSKYTSEYHLYAANLDWTKSVGLMVYADGSGEYGLKNPGSSYLLAGADGLINVAKRNNLVLLTPFAPNKSCSDGDGSCWYLGDPVGYATWAEELVAHVQSQYPVSKSRVAFGGYSSGAQLATEYYAPSGAASRTMNDGVLVAISYGGSPKVSNPSFSQVFKDRVHMTWDTGDRDPSWTSGGSYGVQAGYDWYTNNGFDTSLTLVPGEDHSRSGQFGMIMEREIREHVPAAP